MQGWSFLALDTWSRTTYPRIHMYLHGKNTWMIVPGECPTVILYSYPSFLLYHQFLLCILTVRRAEFWQVLVELCDFSFLYHVIFNNHFALRFPHP